EGGGGDWGGGWGDGGGGDGGGDWGGGWDNGGPWEGDGWDGATSILDDDWSDPSIDEYFVQLPDPDLSDCRTDGYLCVPFLEPVGWLNDLVPGRTSTLIAIDTGALHPDAWTRLGAYEATSGYAPGTVGYAVHNAIGDLYVALGSIGEEHIGLVFNSPEAKALFGEPVTSSANLGVATIEYNYWVGVKNADPSSWGARAGAAFTPEVRAWIQEHIYADAPPPARNVPHT
ncbi:MAG: hypothetical protein ABI678_17580, partial [Kofleriaceae bacterium]